MRPTTCAALALCALAALAGWPATAATPESHPFSVHDMIAMDRISDPQVSPDGRRIAFVVSALDLPANKRRTDIHLVNLDGSGLRKLTSNEAADTSPRWSPDGQTLYFLSTRGGSSQVWKLGMDGGESSQVTKLPVDVGAYLVSPDGRSLAVALDVFADCDNLDCTVKRLEQTAARKATGQIFDQLMIRHWDTWSDGRRSHWFAMRTEGGSYPLDLMKGMDADSPSKPFGGSEDAAFAPDGKTLVFSAKNVGREEAWSTNFDLFAVPVDGSAAPRDLTAANQATDNSPVFSPDGKTLAYLAMSVPGYEADRTRIMLMAYPSGTPRVLAESWDFAPSSIAFAPNGRTIYVPADNRGQKSIFAIDVASGRAQPIVKEGTADNPSPARDRLVYMLDSLTAPAEIYSVKPDGSDARAITHLNHARMAAAHIGKPEQFSFKGWNNETVYAYVVGPADFDPARKYPVALLIHGGPQVSMGNHFHYRWNPQAYAGAGYASVIIEFHGTPGYGQAFTDSIEGDWGGKPLEDLKKGLAAALEKYSWMDGDNVCALGASFGGYMINWIAGNWPDRFKCLVAHDGNIDERMAYYDTEELWFPERDHQGTPWENPKAYEGQNPANFVKNWKTPMLVIHGGKDYRVVETQGFGTFNALQRRGIPSRFLYFPDENHWVLKPANSILWHDTVLEWLDRWTKSARAGTP